MRVTDNHPGHALLQNFLGAVDIALSCEVLSLDDADTAWDLAEGDLSPGHRRHGHGGAGWHDAPCRPFADWSDLLRKIRWRRWWRRRRRTLSDRLGLWLSDLCRGSRFWFRLHDLDRGNIFNPGLRTWRRHRQARRLQEVRLPVSRQVRWLLLPELNRSSARPRQVTTKVPTQRPTRFLRSAVSF